MRPQDIVILLKIAALGKTNWLIKDLAAELFISQSEVSESLHRSMEAGLLDTDKFTIMKKSFLDFLKHGLKYVFPEHPGAIVRGMATAHSAKPLSENIYSEDNYVWPYGEGKMRGQSIRPLYPSVPKACLKDDKLYELLALADAIRVGKNREENMAIKELEKRLS